MFCVPFDLYVQISISFLRCKDRYNKETKNNLKFFMDFFMHKHPISENRIQTIKFKYHEKTSVNYQFIF